jgi:hypothetical protein
LTGIRNGCDGFHEIVQTFRPLRRYCTDVPEPTRFQDAGAIATARFELKKNPKIRRKRDYEVACRS